MGVIHCGNFSPDFSWTSLSILWFFDLSVRFLFANFWLLSTNFPQVEWGLPSLRNLVVNVQNSNHIPCMRAQTPSFKYTPSATPENLGFFCSMRSSFSTFSVFDVFRSLYSPFTVFSVRCALLFRHSLVWNIKIARK